MTTARSVRFFVNLGLGLVFYGLLVTVRLTASCLALSAAGQWPSGRGALPVAATVTPSRGLPLSLAGAGTVSALPGHSLATGLQSPVQTGPGRTRQVLSATAAWNL